MNAESIESVTVAYPGTTANYFQCDRLLTQSISEIVPRLKVSIESAGFWILHEIDPQGLLKRGGYEIRAARQILFFHPRFMARLLRADAAALIEAPLKRPPRTTDRRCERTLDKSRYCFRTLWQ
jgi:hypothetical protein